MEDGDRPASNGDLDGETEPSGEVHTETTDGPLRDEEGIPDERAADGAVPGSDIVDDSDAVNAFGEGREAGSPRRDDPGVEAIDDGDSVGSRDRFPEEEVDPTRVRETSEQRSTDTAEKFDYRRVSKRFRHDVDGPFMWIREILASALIVLVLGVVLFALSGVWPPMVAVESGSMEPNMEVGDLVFVTEPGRFSPGAADNDIGVVTAERGAEAEYRKFGAYGSVIIFSPPGRTGSPIIHRAMLHVEEGDDWYDRADGRYHSASDCDELANCPAPHDGFITLGDNNRQYDQVSGLAEPVREEHVTGVARVRVPYLGYVRLITTGHAEIGDVLSSTTGHAGPLHSVISAPNVAPRPPFA